MQNPRLIGLALTLVVALSTGCSVCLLSPPPPRSYSVSLRDMDGDGDLDLSVGNCCRNEWGVSGGPGVTIERGYSDAYNMVWLNDGSGRFADSGQRLGNEATGDVALGDLDGDGDLDAFEVNHETCAGRKLYPSRRTAVVSASASITGRFWRRNQLVKWQGRPIAGNLTPVSGSV